MTFNQFRSSQNKTSETEFFSSNAFEEEYNVFTDESNLRIIDACIYQAGIKAGMRVADLGCGWGVFTRALRDRGCKTLGVDICHALLVSASKVDPSVTYLAADAENLPFASASLDAVLLSGLIHHFPDPSACAKEVHRVLKVGGVFAAFDPNRRNPFMWLYRDWDSPFYSSRGVTENERPIKAEIVADIFNQIGFKVRTNYLSNLNYRYIASSFMRKLLPIYNFIDSLMFRPQFMQPFSAFVITSGVKHEH